MNTNLDAMFFLLLLGRETNIRFIETIYIFTHAKR